MSNKSKLAVGITLIVGGGIAKIIDLLNDKTESQKVEYLEGRVLKEFGTVNSIIEPNIAQAGISSQPEVYCLVVETNEGLYSIQVNGNAPFGADVKPLYALAAAIEVGDTIRFPVREKLRDVITSNHFSKDRIGMLYSCHIELKEKAKQ